MQLNSFEILFFFSYPLIRKDAIFLMQLNRFEILAPNDI